MLLTPRAAGRMASPLPGDGSVPILPNATGLPHDSEARQVTVAVLHLSVVIVGAYPTVDGPFLVRVSTQVRERYGTITTAD